MDLTDATAGGPELLSFAASLFVVIGAIIVLGWLYSRSSSLGGANSDVINVVASKALGTKERLLLIEVADQQLLVGMTASQVQTLHIFENPVVSAAPQPMPAGFAGRLRTAIAEIRR